MLATLIAAGVFSGGATPPVEDGLPTVDDFRERFPRFAAVSDARIEYWLARHAPVTDAWDDDDYFDAILELTAHNLVINDELPGDGGGSMVGVTRFRSASMDVSFSERAANSGLTGGYGSTKYGQMFAVRLRRHGGGPRLVGYAC